MKRWHPTWYPRWYGQGTFKPLWDSATDQERAFYFWTDVLVAIVGTAALGALIKWFGS